MELIETYWNVNTIDTDDVMITGIELIETYWNVNAYLEIAADGCESGINRNILECK